MQIQLNRSALALLAGTLATLIEPAPPMLPSAWAAAHVVLPDGEHRGERIDLTRTPHIVEPLDLLGPDSPVNEIGVMKSGQSAFTTMLQCSIGHSIDCDPCDMMIIEPTDGALTDFNSTKLTRLIEGTAPLKRKVYPQTSRSAFGSTTYEKKFPRGALNLALASSPADLRLKTIKKAFCDEIDEYEDDLDGQGDPLELIAGRQISFLASATWKRAYVSTPTVKGASKIEKVHERGDKRRWHVRCPHCTADIVFEWHEPFEPGSFGLKFGKVYPHSAHYVTQCCGSIIEPWQKLDLYRAGRWIATAPAPGRFPTYHFDALSSPFVPWDETAKKFCDAGSDPDKLKAFWNLFLGLPYEMTGDAPDHVRLMERREDYPLGKVPPGALLLTVFADVQMRGIYVEVLAHAPDRSTWPIFADYLDGATTDVDQGAFAALSELYHRTWPDGYGNAWRHDEFGIDAGYRTHVVYEWTRRHPGSKALKGEDGWARVPLGVARDVDVDYRGKTIKGGAKLRVVGTWPLKSAFYTYLALTAQFDGSAVVYPPGYCHFGRFLDENYFRQITAEYLDEETYRGRIRKVWKVASHRDNHFFDCRIGNLALAHAYTASFTADDWARLAKERGIPEDLRHPDLFAPRAFVTPGAVATPPVEAKSAPDQFERLAQLNKGL